MQQLLLGPAVPVQVHPAPLDGAGYLEVQFLPLHRLSQPKEVVMMKAGALIWEFVQRHLKQIRLLKLFRIWPFARSHTPGSLKLLSGSRV